MSTEQKQKWGELAAALDRALIAAQRIRTLGAWIRDPHRLPYADSVDANGEGDFIWRFRDNSDDDKVDGFEYRRGTAHPKGKSNYKWLGDTAEDAIEALTALGLSPEMLVRPSFMY